MSYNLGTRYMLRKSSNSIIVGAPQLSWSLSYQWRAKVSQSRICRFIFWTVTLPGQRIINTHFAKECILKCKVLIRVSLLRKYILTAMAFGWNEQHKERSNKRRKERAKISVWSRFKFYWMNIQKHSSLDRTLAIYCSSSGNNNKCIFYSQMVQAASNVTTI